MLGLGNSITGGAALDDFTPASLGSTLLAWYQFDTGQTNLSGTDGNADNEMKWEDQSGGSRHATQRTDSAKPTFTSGYVDFEETSASDRLGIVTGDGAIRLGATSGTDACTIIMAVRRESIGQEGRILGSSNSEVFGFGANNNTIITKSTGGTTINELAAADWNGNGSATEPFIAGEDFVLTYTRDTDGEQLFFKNNIAMTFDTESNPLADGEVDIAFLGAHKGSDNVKAFDGRIYEMIICDTVLSTSNRQATTSYAMSKVGL